MPWINRREVGYAMLAGVGLSVLWQLTRWLTRRSPQKDTKGSLMKVLFFPDNEVSCRTHFTERHGCTSQRCRFSHDPENAYAQLLQYVKSAKKCINLCVYSITCSELADVIVKLYKLGIQVRVITDSEQLEASGSQVGHFRMNGIQVRQNEQPHLMHHKFLIIDNWILITGSFNWTRQAIVGNNENLIVTAHPKLVPVYQSEFEKLWSMFDPKRRANSLKLT